MRHKKGKKSGGNRILAIWGLIANTQMKLKMARNALTNNRNQIEGKFTATPGGLTNLFYGCKD